MRDPEQMRRLLAEFHCPYCGSGPWKSVANHAFQSHGKYASEVKKDAGIPRSRSLIAPSTKEVLGQRARERDSVRNMDGMDHRYGPRTISEAGRASWRATLPKARDAQRKIPVEDHDAIRQRIKAGDLKKDIAADYGVSVTRIRQIEQFIEYVPTKIAPR